MWHGFARENKNVSRCLHRLNRHRKTLLPGTLNTPQRNYPGLITATQFAWHGSLCTPKGSNVRAQGVQFPHCLPHSSPELQSRNILCASFAEIKVKGCLGPAHSWWPGAAPQALPCAQLVRWLAARVICEELASTGQKPRGSDRCLPYVLQGLL
jgi:hypothetical protein